MLGVEMGFFLEWAHGRKKKCQLSERTKESKKKRMGIGDVAQWVEHLPSMHKA